MFFFLAEISIVLFLHETHLPGNTFILVKVHGFSSIDRWVKSVFFRYPFRVFPPGNLSDPPPSPPPNRLGKALCLARLSADDTLLKLFTYLSAVLNLQYPWTLSFSPLLRSQLLKEVIERT